MQLQVVTSALQQHASVGALPHVRALISSFLGPSPNLSLRSACEFGAIELLDWIWESSPTSEAERTPRWTLTNYLRSEPYYYKYQFHEATQVAARRGDLQMVKWFFGHFSGCEVPSAAVVEAAEGGHLPVLQYLLENDAGRDCSRVEKQVVLDEDKWTDSVPVMPEGWKGPGNVVRWGSHAITAAVIGRHPEVARWLVDSTPRINDEGERSQLVELAVNIGAFEIAELYMAPDANLVDCVDIRLQTAAIETLLDRGYLQQSTEASAIAIWALARDGSLDLMKRVAGLHRRYPRKKGERMGTVLAMRFRQRD